MEHLGSLLGPVLRSCFADGTRVDVSTGAVSIKENQGLGKTMGISWEYIMGICHGNIMGTLGI